MVKENRKIYGCFIGQPISARDLFDKLPFKNKKKINAIRKHIKIPKGKIVSELESFMNSVYILRNGHAELSFKNELTGKIYSRQIEVKEILGLRRLFSNSPNQKEILTLSNCLFDIYPAPEFFQLLSADPKLSFRLLEVLASNIQASYSEFTSTVF